MIAEFGNMLIVVPYMIILTLGVVFIMIAIGDRKGKNLPNLTALRKHPLRHLQVELNRTRKAARAKVQAERDAKEGKDPDEKDGKKPRPRRRRRPGSSWDPRKP